MAREWLHRVLLAAAVSSCLLATVAEAQAQAGPGQDIYEEQLRVRLDEQLPEAREMGLDGGGWFSFALFTYDDAAADRNRTLRQFELRLWGSANIYGAHRAYVRGVVGWDDWNNASNPAGDDSTDEMNYPEVERAWYQFHYGAAVLHQTGQRPDLDFKVKVGRAFHEIGTALTLSMPLDMIKFNVTAGDWETMFFLAKTIRNSRNIDNSQAVARKNDRCMWGFQITYTGFDRHRPFFYYWSQRDHTSPYPADPSQRYDYTSKYLGLGSEGTILLPRLRYQTELVAELGETFSNGVALGGQDPICAMAYDLVLDNLFDLHMSPKVSFEYLWASGDTDRNLSSTATLGGNTPGTRDNAFNAFGFRDTGIAFASRISNLHMYALGAGFFPFEDKKLLRKMEVGSKLFFYHKSADGAIGDPTGSVNDSVYLGVEADLYCNWRITSDLTWTIRYGAFFPGEAFPVADTCRQFLFTGVTYSF